MKKASFSLALLVALSVTIASCGGKSKATNTHVASGFAVRALVSNPLFPTGSGFNSPVINIVDAERDTLSFTSSISILANSTQPSLMAVSPSLKYTIVFSPQGNTIAVIDNTTEAIANIPGGTTSVPTITLPGFTESMAIAEDNTTAYVAVPSAPIVGQPPGALEVINITTGTIKASIPVPGAHFIALSPDGNHLLVFSDNSDTVTVITTILIGTSTEPRSFVTGFDRPVWGIFTGSTSAYILNCGQECGGAAAGVSLLNGFPPSNTTVGFTGTTVPVTAATNGLLSGSTLYVAGTAPHTPCVSGTAATTCGTLTLLNANSMTVAATATITDGYHNHLEMGSNGQLFLGAHGCTNINISGGEVRGCLSIFNSRTSAVVVPPALGDVTGIQPIRGRNVVYVVQGGNFTIYDTTTDKLQMLPNNPLNKNGQIDIVGLPYDVKLVN